MNNPFKKDGEILPVASINSMYIDDTLAYDLFRPVLIIDEILKHKHELGITNHYDNHLLLLQYNNLLSSDIESIKKKAHEIATQFGDTLARILATLFQPSEQSKKNRPNWTDVHWNYWKSIDQIYLVGGLTSPILTQIFYNRINAYFQSKGITNKQITFIEGSSNLGTKGLATLIEDGDYLLFDFGQTNIKRARHFKQHNKVVIDHTIPLVKSDYLFYKTKNEKEVIKIANKLDKYIQNVILDTIKITAYTGNRINMSIANYVSKGKIYANRGGYGKLALISDNYQKHLSESLSKHLNKEMEVDLYHDTSAMALQFKDQKNTAVISLGTAFGIAFIE